jgi:hypothetical protein
MRKELLFLPILLIVFAGCVQLPSSGKDCGDDWNCLVSAAADCSHAKATRMDAFEGNKLKIEVEVNGGVAGACDVRIHPLELKFAENAEVDDKTKSMAGFISFTDMTCVLSAESLKTMDFTASDFETCTGSLADIINEAMVEHNETLAEYNETI